LVSDVIEEVRLLMFAPGLTNPLEPKVVSRLCCTLLAATRAWLSPIIIILWSLC